MQAVAWISPNTGANSTSSPIYLQIFHLMLFLGVLHPPRNSILRVVGAETGERGNKGTFHQWKLFSHGNFEQPHTVQLIVNKCYGWCIRKHIRIQYSISPHRKRLQNAKLLFFFSEDSQSFTLCRSAKSLHMIFTQCHQLCMPLMQGLVYLFACKTWQTAFQFCSQNRFLDPSHSKIWLLKLVDKC